MHSSLGHAVLAGVAGLEAARELVLCHHEYWDGSGYPEGRRGAQIPRTARIFALVDSYEDDPELVAIFRGIDRATWCGVYDS